MELSRRRNSSRWRRLRRGRQRARRWRLRTIDVSTRPRGSNEVSPVRSVPRLGRGSSPICSSYGRGENKSAERVASSRQRERERGGGIAGCPGWVPVGAGARCNSLRLWTRRSESRGVIYLRARSVAEKSFGKDSSRENLKSHESG